MTEDQIKHMVDRFLGWKLPSNFNPDCGIIFDAEAAKKLNPRNHKYEPSGTNLFDATQAAEMVRYMIEGLVCGEGKVWQPIETAPKDGRAFLACNGNWITACHWHRHQQCWVSNGPIYSPYPADEQPTHWQPMPMSVSASAHDTAGAESR